MDVSTGMTETGGSRGPGIRERSTLPAPGPVRRRRTRPSPGAPPGTTAILFATAPADGAGPAAALPWEGGTVAGRLVAQLASLGIRSAHVVTREPWREELEAALADAPLTVRVHASPTVSADLTAVAGIARRARGGLVILPADIVTHREALAGLLADPRLGTAVLASNGRAGRPFAFRAKSQRGRIVSAGSPYHAVHRSNTGSLGVLKVAPADRASLAAVAEHLAGLTTPPLPPGWHEELEAKGTRWRRSLARIRERAEARAGHVAAADPEPEVDTAPEFDDDGLDAETGEPLHVHLTDAEEAEWRRRLALAPDDAGALLLVGLVRRGVHVGNSFLRELFWARPLSAAAVEQAAHDIASYDEDRVLLNSAVKASDGFFTTFFVSPYSKYVARWAARVGLTPNQVTTISLFIGIVAAAAFATGTRAGLVAGAVLVHVSFVTDCVDGQLARYTRTFSKLGAWLDSVFDRAKEYVVFAGLAIGADRAGDDVWLLAAAALALQSMRHSLEFSYGASRHRLIAAVQQPPLEEPFDAATQQRVRALAAGPAQPSAAPPRRSLVKRVLAAWHVFDGLPGVRWAKKMIALPIGERFAAIALTSAFFTPRTTFAVLLVWGGFAALYTLAGRVLRSIIG